MSYKFRPISIYNKKYESRKGISRKRHPFNDKRLYSVFETLSAQMETEQSSCIQQISTNAAQSASFYRFYGNQKIAIPELIKMNCEINTDLSDTEVLCLGDSTSFNLNKHKGRIKDFKKLGVLQDGKTKGFHAHASLALNAKDGATIGLTDILYWHRKGKKYKASQLAKSDKENHKWYMGASNSKAVLATAKRVSYIFDREADDYTLFKQLQLELQQDFVIRAQHNRQVVFQGKQSTIRDCLANCPVATTYEKALPVLDHYSWTSGKRIKRAARVAKLELRYVQVKVLAPSKLKSKDSLKLTAIHVREIGDNLAPEEEPLDWLLWTTHKIDSPQDAIKCIRYYLYRWDIEQLFRTMKKKGFNQEATELETIDGIVKQTTMTFKASTKVMQLVSARNQEDAPPTDYVFDREQQIVLNKVNERLEGKTDKQKNPFPSEQLSWAAWIIARLGGWKGYQSQRPPGPITMKIGLDKFNSIYEGYLLFDTR